MNKILTTVQVLYVGGFAYFLFKLVRMYQPSREGEYISARRSLTFFAVITLLLIVSTIINAVICTINFHKGLKPHIWKPSKSSDEEKSTEMGSTTPGDNVPSRMMID